MQKIISYTYPNRIQLLADLASFNVEYTNVYQRNVKIYNGVDNVIQFDIKNADQKRIDLATYDSMELHVMDSSGNALPNSPYTVTATATKGIATATIPADDLIDLIPQSFSYSVLVNNGTSTTPLYVDGHFNALGTLELIGTVVPNERPARVFNTFSGEIDYAGNVTHKSSAIAAKFYEAIPTTSLSFSIDVTNFIGTIYLQGTTDTTISVESFKDTTRLQEFTTSVATSSTVTFNNIPVDNYAYFRICWTNPIHGFAYGDQTSYNQQLITKYGSVNKITVS